MTIKEFSEKTKIPISTIRYYDKLGLFPGLSRDSSGYRNFSNNDFEWVIFIDRLKDTGMKIKDIVDFTLMIAEGDSTIPMRLEILEIHRNELVQKIERENSHLIKLNEKIDFYRNSLALK